MIAACAARICGRLANLWLDVPFVPATERWLRRGQHRHGHAVLGSGTKANPSQPQPNRRRYSAPYIPTQGHGIYAATMVRYFQQNGFRTFALAGQPTDLEHELARGRPLIAALKPESATSLHYVVVVGLDQPERVVLVNDPAQRKLLKEDQSQFEREWKATGNWTLLAVPETSTH